MARAGGVDQWLSVAAGYDPFATSGAWRRNRAKIVVYVILTLFAAYYLLPLWVVIANAFRDLPEISPRTA